jgi:multisubunit Na+/H+ antiporter MnhG subunit
MFIYNRLTELTILQSLPVLVLLLLGLILGIILLKDKPTLKLILISLVLGILVSLVSGLVGWGSYSGTGYAERFGWPLCKV